MMKWGNTFKYSTGVTVIGFIQSPVIKLRSYDWADYWFKADYVYSTDDLLSKIFLHILKDNFQATVNRINRPDTSSW